MSNIPPEGQDRPYGPSDPSPQGSGGYPHSSGGYPQDSGGHQQGSGGYPPGPSFQSAPGYYGGPPTNDRDNNLGVVALVTGIIGLLICQPVGIAAIIYGRRSQAAQAAGTANNGSLGAVGFWLGWVAVALMVLGILLFATGVLSLSLFAEDMNTL